MLPKRQKKWKIGQKRAVNVAKKATFAGPGTIELTVLIDLSMIVTCSPLAQMCNGG